MVNSCRAGLATPFCFNAAESSVANESDYGRYGGRSVQIERSNHAQKRNTTRRTPDETVNTPKPGHRKMDVLEDAFRSRVGESFDAANKVISKSAAFIDKYRPLVRQSPGNRYCKEKHEKVRDSGRNIVVVWCPTEGDDCWLKNILIGREYFPGMLIYSTRNETFNANGKVTAGGQTVLCGDLAVLYAKGFYGPGKKGFSQCDSPADLARLMDRLGIESWGWLQNRMEKPKETHAFHANDFSIALKTLVHRYWEMPIGEKVVFILHTERVRGSETHAMVITLEKKAEGVMVLRHYDPNWTNSCQKVILNHPDHAAYLELRDLYRPEHFQLFFKNGVAKLSSVETTEESHEAAFHWYDRHQQVGDTGSRLSAEKGVWYERRRLTGKGEQPVDDVADQIQCLENTVAGIVAEVINGSDKTECEKEAIVEFFLREIDNAPFREKILATTVESDFSAGLRFFSSDDLVMAFRQAVSHNTWELAERIVMAVLSDSSRTEKEKIAILDHYSLDEIAQGNEFARRIHPLVIRSNLSLMCKLRFFEDRFYDDRHDFERCVRAISELTDHASSLPETAGGLKLAIYLNDVKLAGHIMNAILQDDERSEQEKMTALGLDNTSHIGSQLVAGNVEVFALYLAKIMADNLPDRQKAELLGRSNGMDRRAICWALASGNVDQALLFIRCVAGSTLSLAVKHEILSPGSILGAFDYHYGDSHNEQLKEIRETINQLIAEQGETDFVRTE